MIIAVCSDIHDNIWALERALPGMAEADVLMFCGDFCAPFTLVQLAEGAAGRPLHIVWGNNDGDRRLLTQQAQRFEQIVLHGDTAQIELAGLRVGVNHYPDIALGLADSGQFDLVCYGHDHVAHVEHRTHHSGSCLLLNPGEIMGRLGSRTFCLVDTATSTSRFVAVDCP
ncbi:MAG: YfcE family phosphodiesterase [bacterium]|nr:YfcE family phosphodiesterase [bacterium]